MKTFQGVNFSDEEYTALFGNTRQRAPSPAPAGHQPLSNTTAAWASWVDGRFAEHLRGAIPGLMQAIATEVRRFVDEATAKSIAPLQERCRQLEADNAELRRRLVAAEAQDTAVDLSPLEAEADDLRTRLTAMQERSTEQAARADRMEAENATLHARLTVLEATVDLAPLEAEAAAAVRRAIAKFDAALAAMPVSLVLSSVGDLLCVRGDGSTESLGRVQGKDGATPPGIDDVEVDGDGNLIVRMTDGRMIARGRVRGEPGRDGKDGAAGLGIDDLDAHYDGNRTMTLRWSRGERVVEKSFTVPVMLYTGIYKDDTEYAQGDAVTWAGGIWVCMQQATKSKPGDGPGNGWRLACKAGRNGASSMDIARKVGAFRGTSEREFIESIRGKEGPPGPMGPPGRDRTAEPYRDPDRARSGAAEPRT